MSQNFGVPVAFFVLVPAWDWAQTWTYLHADLIDECEAALFAVVDAVAKRQETARQ